jgi:CRP-like cAMP-binding protein
MGLDALIPGALRSASAEAKRPVRLLALDMRVLRAWSETHPALLRSLALEATEKLVGAAKELAVVDA